MICGTYGENGWKSGRLCDKIKKYSNSKIEEIINNNKEISDFMFNGIGNFEEPFTVHYLYENGELKDDCFIPFKPTTGSGRSKGTFTIVIKPKKNYSRYFTIS